MRVCATLKVSAAASGSARKMGLAAAVGALEFGWLKLSVPLVINPPALIQPISLIGGAAGAGVGAVVGGGVTGDSLYSPSPDPAPAAVDVCAALVTVEVSAAR